MNLYSYISRLETMLRSRQDIQVEMLTVRWTENGAKFRSELRFYDNSRLSIFDLAKQVGFHYQDADGNLIFRYDNAPHHPHLATFPDHKHAGNGVIEAEPPDLNNVLTEIDRIIYNEERV
ncbi:DUF6516 family protein [Desulfococcaceae bacterium HSG8]|nr:DUF6516 family protein [Desulfococcaceae bacterium HSG8]